MGGVQLRPAVGDDGCATHTSAHFGDGCFQSKQLNEVYTVKRRHLLAGPFAIDDSQSGFSTNGRLFTRLEFSAEVMSGSALRGWLAFGEQAHGSYKA